MRTRDVLVVDGRYHHCGEPMTLWGTGMSSLRSTRYPESLGVYLATRVLHCACGFQMEIPDQSLPQTA